MRRVLVWALALFLVACDNAPYWSKRYAEVPLSETTIVYVDYPGNDSKARGYWNPVTKTIQIKKYLKPIDEECALRHEHAHRKGWWHPENRAFVWDCGPTDEQLERGF